MGENKNAAFYAKSGGEKEIRDEFGNTFWQLSGSAALIQMSILLSNIGVFQMRC
jgi:hypothetical protein